MPKARKGPRSWYARAKQLTAMAEELQAPVRHGNGWEDEAEFREREAAYVTTKRRLEAESKRCWIAGGRLELEKIKSQADQQPGTEGR